MPGIYYSFSAKPTMITLLNMKGLNLIIPWLIPFTDIKLYMIWKSQVKVLL